MPDRSSVGWLAVSEGVYLRLLEDADAPELHRVIEANQASLARWLPWAADQTLGETLDFIRRTRSQLSENQGFQFAVIVGREIAGMVGHPSIDWASRSTRVGYWLDEAHQGRGTMTAAVRVLVDHALMAWQLDRVEIRAAVENHRSRAIPERLGFREEGTFRRAELIGGRYLDSVVYAMLSADW